MIANKDYVASVFLKNWLCLHPYAADDYEWGVKRTTRDRALKRKHIQCNPSAMQSMIVVDVDDEDGMSLCLWNVPCRPNLIIENPDNGHVHAVWFLKDPVCTSSAGHAAPKLYLRAVTRGLRKLVHGDPNYVSLIMKNPLHEAWDVMVVDDKQWTLDELSMHLRAADCMPEDEPKIAPAAELLGRNSTLFDSVRKWAYRAVRKYLGSYDSFHRAVTGRLSSLNEQFIHKLSFREIKGLARSITKWVWKSSLRTKSQKDYDKTFSKIQRARGIKGAVKSLQSRQKKFMKFKSDVLENIEVLSLSAKEIADIYSVTPRTAYRWLKTLKSHPSLSSAIHSELKSKHSVSSKAESSSSKTSSAHSSSSTVSTSSDSTNKSLCIPFDLAKCHKDNDKTEESIEEDSFEQFWICPECGSPVWSSSLCTCMLDEDWEDEE